MDEFKKIWEPVLQAFKDRYPDFAKDVVDWYPIGQMEIAVKNSKGDKHIYNMINQTFAALKTRKTSDTYLDEDEWSKEFSYKLNKKMRMIGINQEGLSDLTGISRVSISKYMNGKAIPSVYNLEKIAWALECPISEFTNII